MEPSLAGLFRNIDQAVKKEFDSTRRVLSLEAYFALVRERPDTQLRGSASFALDMMEFFGKHALPPDRGNGLYEFGVFSRDTASGARAVMGQEHAQTAIHRALTTFVRQGANNKLVLLHGPNGSAKSSLIHAFMAGLEDYSREADGALYAFNWVFPHEKLAKSTIGIGSKSAYGSAGEPASYAHLPDDQVAARIPCDLRDHPLLLVPVENRKAFLVELLGQERAGNFWERMPVHMREGDLCHRCRAIFDALLTSQSGDFKKVLAHVQVERVFLSRRYRRGLATVEPQMHVDAQYQLLSYKKSLGDLPPALHGIQWFALAGDLIDGNRGVVEYSDLLKRPIDAFKYLLIACETGAVNVGSTIAYLDTLMIGSTNELQLDAFKEFPDFVSFKGRIDLVRVPYLLSVNQERRIYQPEIKQIGLEKHVAPHTDWVLALWAVLTRLKKPNSINYPPNVSAIVSALAPIDKARLFDTGEMPVTLSPEDRKLLRSAIPKIRDEYTSIPYYEGRIGASARELKSIAFGAAQNPDFACLSPLAVLRELEEFVKRVSEHDFLKQDVKDGYHDCAEFVNLVRHEYVKRVDKEVRDAIGLYDSKQWEEFLRKYVQQLAALLKKEKIKNPVTGRMEDPDHALVAELERIVDAPQGGGQESTELHSFRQSVISTVGAWSIDHPGKPVAYAKVFPEFWSKLEKHYYESQKSILTQMHNALDVDATDGPGAELARKTIANLTANMGYCESCAREVLEATESCISA